MDGEAFGREVVDIVRGYVEREIAPLKSENEGLKARLAELEARPLPEKGEKGDAGVPGQDGKDVDHSIVKQFVIDEVAKAVAELPPPERGEKGDPGERGEKGDAGDPGRDGTNGKDGRGVKDLLIDREGQLVATMDDGEMKNLGPVVGKDGRDGKDGERGADGFSLESFDVEALDERTIALKFAGNGQSHSYELAFPVMVYRDVYKAGETYTRGDVVTWGGSLWHCNAETKDKPGTDAWTLAAKKGRDGKDGKNG